MEAMTVVLYFGFGLLEFALIFIRTEDRYRQHAREMTETPLLAMGCLAGCLFYGFLPMLGRVLWVAYRLLWVGLIFPWLLKMSAR